VDIFAALFHAEAGTGDSIVRAVAAAKTAAAAAGHDPNTPEVSTTQIHQR
jgi:hypothetical protein